MAEFEPSAVRLVKDAQGASKGFGYVEFPSQETLKNALTLSNTQLQGRSVRISVAEPPSGSKREFTPSAADEASQWRRAGPLPQIASAAQPRRQTSFGSNPSPAGDDRDWGAARGARFTPSVPSTPSFRREFSGPGQSREPGAADEANQWRSAKPMGRDLPPHQRGSESGEVSPSLADTEKTVSQSSHLF